MKRLLLSILIVFCLSSLSLAGQGMGPGPGTPAAPAGFSDNFTGTNGTALATHDANWTALSGFTLGAMTIQNGHAAGGSWTNAGAVYSASTKDVSSVTLLANVYDGIYRVKVRAGASVVGYECAIYSQSGGNWKNIVLTRSGVGKFNTASMSIPVNASHVFTIELVGNVVNCKIDGAVAYDGANYATWTENTTLLPAGNPGIAIDGYSGVREAFDLWTDTP